MVLLQAGAPDRSTLEDLWSVKQYLGPDVTNNEVKYRALRFGLLSLQRGPNSLWNSDHTSTSRSSRLHMQSLGDTYQNVDRRTGQLEFPCNQADAEQESTRSTRPIEYHFMHAVPST